MENSIEIVDGKTYINGKYYPMWSQFIDKKEEWIGGELEDFGDSFDRRCGFGAHKTKIKDMALKPNGEDSAFFEIIGEDFSCGFGVKYGGISPNGSGFDGITFNGYGGQEFRISKKIK